MASPVWLVKRACVRVLGGENMAKMVVELTRVEKISTFNLNCLYFLLDKTVASFEADG